MDFSNILKYVLMITIVPITPRIITKILIQSISMNTKADRLIISHMAISETILLRKEMDRFSLIF